MQYNLGEVAKRFGVVDPRDPRQIAALDLAWPDVDVAERRLHGWGSSTRRRRTADGPGPPWGSAGCGSPTGGRRVLATRRAAAARARPRSRTGRGATTPPPPETTDAPRVGGASEVTDTR
jgi:hypothetical protein